MDMSEFTNHKAERVEKLTGLFQSVIREEFGSEHVKNYRQVIELATPADVVAVVDRLMQLEIPMPELKKGINKALNLLNKSLQDFPYQPPKSGSYLDVMLQNNEQIDRLLKIIRPLLKEINRGNLHFRSELSEKLGELTQIDLHYQIKENALFPLIEKHLPEYRCLQVMWSFHDDIRHNLKEAIEMLATETLDLKKFNRLAGDIFFNIYAIKFREERILFPVISGIIPEEQIDALFAESQEIGFPFVQPDPVLSEKRKIAPESASEIDLGTGVLTPEQIRLVFNHLPVDITYVDENNKVRYFSTPEKRIFRRTNSIIGRDVKNCHPHESVHLVEQIVENFRSGKKDSASFWIRMKGEFILIQYFAVRDEQGTYKGVIEVTQEVSEIRKLQGQKRLLDWE
jgi:hypothetical protein